MWAMCGFYNTGNEWWLWRISYINFWLHRRCLVGSILSWFYSLPGISQREKRNFKNHFAQRAALQEEQRKQSIGVKDPVKLDLRQDIKRQTLRSQTPEQTLIHDNCQLPKMFLQSFKSIKHSIRKGFRLFLSITFIRQTDSLTKIHHWIYSRDTT